MAHELTHEHLDPVLRPRTEEYGRSMSVRLVTTNAVVVAKQFNPTVASQAWLVDIGVLPKAEATEDFAFTPLFAQVTVEDFALLLVPERLQFIPRVEPERQRALIADKVGRFVRAVPHTPFSAVGMNFQYQLVPDHTDVRHLTRRLFFVPGSRLHQAFDVPDARFGAYLSRDVMGCRLKMDVKPIAGTEPGAEPNRELRHGVMIDFNFHHDVTPGTHAAEEVVSTFGKWDEARSMAEGLMETVAEEDRE